MRPATPCTGTEHVPGASVVDRAVRATYGQGVHTVHISHTIHTFEEDR